MALRRVAVLGLILLFTSGCATLINPHITLKRPDGTTLKDGRDYANQARTRYKEAVGDQASLTTLTGLALIPLGAAALGLGITEGSGTIITALGLAGATGFATSQWLSSRPRQQVYVAGMKALNCADEALLPLSFTKEREEAFLAGLKALRASITAVDKQIQLVAQLRVDAAVQDPNIRPEVLTETDRDLDLARAALAQARTVAVAGDKLEGELGRAGLALMVAVEAIDNDVSQALITTQGDIQSLPGIIGGLAQMSTQFTPTATPASTAGALGGLKTDERLHTQSAPKPVTEALNKARAALKQQVTDMESHAQMVAAVVNSVAEGRPLASLKACKVETVSTNIVVEPPGPLEFVVGQAGTRRVLVTGGKPGYGADFDEGTVPGLTVNQPQPGRIVVEATTAAAKEYTLRIHDTAGATRAVKVVVKSAAAAAPAPTAAPGAPSAPVAPAVVPAPAVGPPAVTLTAAEVKTVKSKLCLADAIGLETAAAAEAVRVYREATGSRETGVLTQADIDGLAPAPACQKDRRNYFENSLDPVRIRAIQKKLKVPQTGTIDDATRKAAAGVAKAKSLAPTDGSLTLAIEKAIGT